MRDSDYSAAGPLEVTFMSGSAMLGNTSCAQISIIDDITFEGPHGFSVEVSTVEIESDGTDTLLTIGTTSSAMVYIEDNDGTLYYLHCLTKFFHSTLFFAIPTDVEISMAMSVYSFDEADGTVEVCTELTEAPDDGLECSIVVTLWPIDGPKAGTF